MQNSFSGADKGYVDSYDIDLLPAISEEDKKLRQISRYQKNWAEYYSSNIDVFKLDKTFLFVDQWKSSERARFQEAHKTALTSNILYDAFRKMCGQYRENTPQFEVRSVNGKASPKEIKLRGDYFRHLSQQSRSSEVFETALENALAGGFGAFRVDTQYIDDKSFDQEPILRKIEYPERCYFDPNAELTTKADGHYCGIVIPMSRKEFHEKYPDHQVPQKSDTVFDIYDNSYASLYMQDVVLLIEHYEKEYTEVEIVELSNGMTMDKKDYNEKSKIVKDNHPEEMHNIMIPKIVRKRKVNRCKIMRYLVTNSNILEEEEFVGKELPIIFVPGDLQKVNGREITLSFIRFAIDSQRALNLTQSEIIQVIRTSRRELFMATSGNLGNRVNQWRDVANQQGVLLYEPDPITQQPPIRIEPVDIPVTLMNYLQVATQQIQGTMGMFNSSLGDSDNAISGKAVKQRQVAGNLAGGIFYDNLLRAITQAGRCIMSMLPKLMDNERAINTLPVEGKEKTVTINANKLGSGGGDFTDNDFDVIARSGPSYEVQKEEAISMLINLGQMLPEPQRVLLVDLIAENMDVENKVQIVNRMKTIVPPEILAQEEGRPAPPKQPDPMAMLQQQALQLKAQELEVKKQTAQLDAQTKQQQNQLEAAKLQIEMGELISNQKVEAMRANAEINKALLSKEADTMNALAKIANAHSSIQKAHHASLQHLMKAHSNKQKTG
jgi:portal protein